MLEPTIIYETKNFLAVNKPAGLMVHAAKVNEKKQTAAGYEAKKQPTLVDWLLERYPEIKTVGDDPAIRPGIVHRLDKDTSGVMLVARNQAYFEYLKSLFQDHIIKKTYYAVVFGELRPREGIIDAPIGIVNGTLKRSIRSKKMAKDAATEYKVLKVFTASALVPVPCALVEVHPLTGRTHQIRVHLASMGHPIIGDKLYGKKNQPVMMTLGGRLMLHAVEIAFPEENGSMVTIEAALPEEFVVLGI